jgi:hypothetical protein
MRLWRRAHDQGVSPDPTSCVHAWRLRDVSTALPGPYVCEVCDHCGALRLHGPDAITGPPSNVAESAAIHLETVARRMGPPAAPDPWPHRREQ